MGKEMKRRKDSPMTGCATEDRQYRFWDHTLAEGIADKLVAVDAETGALHDLTPGWNRVFATVMEPGFEVSPDGRFIAMAVNAVPPPYRERTNLDVYLIAADGSGTMRDLTASNPFTDAGPRFSPDGKTVYYLRDAKANAGNRRIARVDLATGASATLTDAYDRSFDTILFASDLIDPIGAYMGLDWKMMTALLSSFIAKENSIATLGVLYGVGEEGVSNVLPYVMSHASALSFLIVLMLFIPCVATVVVMKQEMGSWKWFILSLIFMLTASLGAGIVAYNLALHLGL